MNPLDKYEIQKTTNWEDKFVIKNADSDDQFMDVHDMVNGDCPICFASEDLANTFVQDLVNAGGMIGSGENCQPVTLENMAVVIPTEANFKKGDTFYEVIGVMS